MTTTTKSICRHYPRHIFERYRWRKTRKYLIKPIQDYHMSDTTNASEENAKKVLIRFQNRLMMTLSVPFFLDCSSSPALDGNYKYLLCLLSFTDNLKTENWNEACSVLPRVVLYMNGSYSAMRSLENVLKDVL